MSLDINDIRNWEIAVNNYYFYREILKEKEPYSLELNKDVLSADTQKCIFSDPNHYTSDNNENSLINTMIYRLGDYLYEDIPTRELKYKAKSKDFYAKACDSGDYVICNELGQMYFQEVYRGIPVVQKSLEYLIKGCNGNITESCEVLGHIYHGERKIGVNRDDVKAMLFYKKACVNGSEPSCYRVKEISAANEEREKNTRALDNYTKGCARGDAQSCSNLGLKYQNGEGVQKDPLKAKTLYTKACDGGYSGGCNLLGVMYWYGVNIRQDIAKAKKLFGKSCDSGNAQGCKNYKLLNEKGY